MYQLQDSYEALQCGIEETNFNDWYELEEYIYSNEDVLQRIEGGYAVITEL